MINKFYTIALFFVFGFSCNDVHGYSGSYMTSAMKSAAALALKTIIPTDIASIVLPATNGVRKIYHEAGSETTAHHEAGHAVIIHNMKELRIKSIIIDEYSGGVQLEEFINPTKDEDIQSLIMVYLAGPAAEYEFNFTKKTRFILFDHCYKDLFHQIEFMSDLRAAHKYAMILAEKYCKQNYTVFDQVMVKQEAERILKECYRKTLMQVHAQRSDIQAVAQVVLEKKSISGKTFYTIMRERKRLE